MLYFMLTKSFKKKKGKIRLKYMIQGLAHINRRVLLKSIGLQDYLGAGFR